MTLYSVPFGNTAPTHNLRQLSGAALCTETGTIIVDYQYNTWGKNGDFNDSIYHYKGTAIQSQAAELNPFRYRGYYYDVETGLYYCLTRYLKGEPNLPPGAKKALEKLWKDILEALLKWR